MVQREPAEDFPARVAGIAALAEPARRELYLYVAGREEPVSRDEAAEATGLAHHRVKFHLDRLVEDGLLEVSFRQLSGRRGPGSGRPSKVYRRAEREVSVSLPERRYDLAGRVLARAVEQSAREQVPVLEAVQQAAGRTGKNLAAEAGDLSLVEVLTRLGYEPRADGERVVLSNCPFHALVHEHTELVCGMNVGLLRSLLDGLGHPAVEARLDPSPGRCCVTLLGPAEAGADDPSERPEAG